MFVDVVTDVFEQKHWKKTGEEFIDFEMYIKATELKVEDNVYIIKVKVKDGTSPAPVIK